MRKSLLPLLLLLAGAVPAAALAQTGQYLNPSGITLGDTALFRVSIGPDSFPDDWLSWSAAPENRVSFPQGNTGRMVAARGETEGDVTLTLHIQNYIGPEPTIQAQVVGPTVTDIHAYIICSTNGHAAASAASVQAMLPEINAIYRQIGMSFRLAEVNFVTNDAWLTIPRGNSHLSRAIGNFAEDTGGLECYFIDRIMGQSVAFNTPRGLIASTNANARSIAHEIGHQCGFSDVYVANSGTTLQVTGAATRERLQQDWSGTSSEGYYALGTQQADLVRVLLMFGETSDVKADIPFGDIFGLWYENQWDAVNHTWLRDWHLSPAPVGFTVHANRNPEHL